MLHVSFDMSIDTCNSQFVTQMVLFCLIFEILQEQICLRIWTETYLARKLYFPQREE